MRFEHNRPIDAHRVIAGCAVVVAGVLCWFYQLDWLSKWQLLGCWPLALIALGLGRLVDPELPSRNGWMPMLAGALLLFGNLALPEEHSFGIWIGPVPLRLSWPLLMVVIGSYIVWCDVSRPRPALGDES